MDRGKGLRIIGTEEDLAKDLFTALTDEQKQVALQKKSFGEPGEKTLALKSALRWVCLPPK